MATYQEHLQRQKERGTQNGERAKIHFMSEFLKTDGDTVIVRFPYHTMNDIVYTATHNMVLPGAPYGKRIRCTETPDCELCKQGVKLEERVFIKFLTYTIDESTNEVVLNNTIWDRPAAFADIELKALMDEYGDLSQVLFKIKRSGSGLNTRYNVLPVVNAVLYNPAVYRADFTELDTVDPAVVCSKSIEQYHELLNPTASAQTTNTTKVTKPEDNYFNNTVVTPTTPTQNTYEQPQTPNYNQPRTEKRYQF